MSSLLYIYITLVKSAKWWLKRSLLQVSFIFEVNLVKLIKLFAIFLYDKFVFRCFFHSIQNNW